MIKTNRSNLIVFISIEREYLAVKGSLPDYKTFIYTVTTYNRLYIKRHDTCPRLYYVTVVRYTYMNDTRVTRMCACV